MHRHTTRHNRWNMSENRNASRNGSTGKRVILVNGIPASGKSRLAVELSAYSGWLQLSLDGIKNPFLQRLENVDRPFNRVLGLASYQVIWDIIGARPKAAPLLSMPGLVFSLKRCCRIICNGRAYHRWWKSGARLMLNWRPNDFPHDWANVYRDMSGQNIFPN